MTVRRGPGRPAYDSKQKLVTATCALLAERGYTATSPEMILRRAGVGHGSMYHHYHGKEDLALDAINHMRGWSIAFLEGSYELAGSSQTTNSNSQDMANGTVQPVTTAEEALHRLVHRREGQALIHLLADPEAGTLKPLADAIRTWCDDLRQLIQTALRSDAPNEDPDIADQAAAFLAPEFDDASTDLLARALGNGLLELPRWATP